MKILKVNFEGDRQNPSMSIEEITQVSNDPITTRYEVISRQYYCNTSISAFEKHLSINAIISGEMPAIIYIDNRNGIYPQEKMTNVMLQELKYSLNQLFRNRNHGSIACNKKIFLNQKEGELKNFFTQKSWEIIMEDMKEFERHGTPIPNTKVRTWPEPQEAK